MNAQQRTAMQGAIDALKECMGRTAKDGVNRVRAIHALHLALEVQDQFEQHHETEHPCGLQPGSGVKNGGLSSTATPGEREAFEAWARTLDMDLFREPSCYSDCNTDYSWSAWKARAALAANQPDIGIPISERRPLTDDQLSLMAAACLDRIDDGDYFEIARAVEAAHGITGDGQ